MKDIQIVPEGKTIITWDESTPITAPVTLQPVKGGDFKERAYQLPNNYDYVVGIDQAGQKILVPTKMKG